jgi:hypothetical protein
MQSVISIIGLAVGFTCFALASLWIRYEMTYDTFHKDADRICFVSHWLEFSNEDHLSHWTPYLLASHLKETFPEIEDACNTNTSNSSLTVNGVEYKEINEVAADSAFMRFFDVKVLEGNLDFLIPESKNLAVTAEFAKRIFGNENPLGKRVYKSKVEYTVCAIVDGWPKHSNIFFQILTPNYTETVWFNRNRNMWWRTFLKLKSGIDRKAFEQKAQTHTLKETNYGFDKQILTPITRLRQGDNPFYSRLNIQFGQLYLFAWMGLLVILCSLFNYLTLFISRFKMREKELALRMACGASGKSLFALLSTEFLLLLSFALLLGGLFIRLALRPFQQLSKVYLELSEIYLETFVYIVVVILLALAVFALLLVLFGKHSLNKSFQKRNKNNLRNVLVILQLIISIGFIFCTAVMIKQIYFLHHTDLGFKYKNRASIANYYKYTDNEALTNQLKQIPEITEVICNYYSLMPQVQSIGLGIGEWDDMPDEFRGKSTIFQLLYVTKEFLNYYEFQLATGDYLQEADADEYILINETAAKTLGWKEPLGKSLILGRKAHYIKGVLKDFYNNSPTTPTQAMVFQYAKSEEGQILVKYQDGAWKTCEKKIETLIKQEYPDKEFEILNAEETYDRYLQSENELLKILSFVSIISIIISVFGFFSLISLSCEEKRKEIAIRKINGATMLDILSMYFKTYFSLLIIGAIIAFPVGYYIMKQWLEKYMKQTGIDAWIYLSIIFVMASVIILCVGWRVYRASVENPAEVLKTE